MMHPTYQSDIDRRVATEDARDAALLAELADLITAGKEKNDPLVYVMVDGEVFMRLIGYITKLAGLDSLERESRVNFAGRVGSFRYQGVTVRRES